MATILNKQAYAGMIAENIEWLLKQPRTLERDHIHEILKLAVKYEYDNKWKAAIEKARSPYVRGTHYDAAYNCAIRDIKRAAKKGGK